MIHATKHAIPNGIVFVEDIKGAMPPMPFTDAIVQWTSACIAVVCRHEVDGESELILGPLTDVAQDYEPIFNGSIETPSRELMIAKVPGDPLLTTKVKSDTTAIQIWRNHPTWPDQIIVGWE